MLVDFSFPAHFVYLLYSFLTLMNLLINFRVNFQRFLNFHNLWILSPTSPGHSGSKGDKPEENAENNLRLLSEGDAKASPVPDSPQQEAVTPHVYWRRWLMLALFCAYSFSNAFQWIHLNIIANVIGKFYNESLPQSDYQVWHDSFKRLRSNALKQHDIL